MQSADEQILDHRQTLRVTCELPCAVRSPHSRAEELLDRMGNLEVELTKACDSVSDRATSSALRLMQTAINQLQSSVLHLQAQQAPWSLPLCNRRLTLSLEGLDVELLPGERFSEQVDELELLLQLPEQSPIITRLTVTSTVEVQNNAPHCQQLGGRFGFANESDLRRLRRFVLLQQRQPTELR